MRVHLPSLFGSDSDILGERDFQLLLLANTMSPLGLAIVSPILASLTGPFGVSDANIGLMMSAFSAPAIILIPVMGILSDKYGRKPILLAGLTVYGLAGTSIALTTSFPFVLGLRFLQGMGAAALTPVIITSIGDLYNGTAEATAQGFRFSQSGLSQFLFPLVAGILVSLTWYYPFLLNFLAIPIAAVLFFWFEEPQAQQAKDTSPRERHQQADHKPTSLFDLVTRPRVSAIVFVSGLPPIVWVAFLTYNSVIVAEFIGGSPTHAGMLAAAGSLAIAVAATQAGRITSMFTSRYYPLIVANVALGGGFIAMVFASSLFTAIAGIIVSGTGFGVLLSIYRSIVTGLAPGYLRGSLVSVTESYNRVTITLTPIVMGVGIEVLTPMLDFKPALQYVCIGVAIASSGGGVIGLFQARMASDPE